MNERTSFASWASAFESSRLVIGLKLTSDQKVAYVFVEKKRMEESWIMQPKVYPTNSQVNRKLCVE